MINTQTSIYVNIADIYTSVAYDHGVTNCNTSGYRLECGGGGRERPWT